MMTSNDAILSMPKIKALVNAIDTFIKSQAEKGESSLVLNLKETSNERYEVYYQENPTTKQIIVCEVASLNKILSLYQANGFAVSFRDGDAIIAW